MQIQTQLKVPIKTHVQRPKFESTIKTITPIIASALKESIDQIKIRTSNQVSNENIWYIFNSKIYKIDFFNVEFFQ